jgi:hypothetical protein
MANTTLGLVVAVGRAFSRRAIMLLVLAVTVSCRSPTSVVEPGAVLLHVKCAQATPLPDELRVWVWDDLGELWDNVRVPSSGSLAKGNGQDLGTILVQPDSTQGSLRIHIRGLAQNMRVVDGVVRVDSIADGSRVFEILLDSPAIDDCPFVPSLAGCSVVNSSDAGLIRAGGSSGASGAGGALGGGMTGTGGDGSGGAASSGGTANGGADGGRGGTTAFGGAKGSGGSTGKATSPPASTLPGVACTTESSDANCHPAGTSCYKYCGPESQGYKILSCTSGKYVEGLCTFSSVVDYACYALTSVAPCAAAPPTSGVSCSIEDCKACGSNTGTGYNDGTKTAKIGYCVCSDGKWNCASVGAWPCPGRTGC